MMRLFRPLLLALSAGAISASLPIAAQTLLPAPDFGGMYRATIPWGVARDPERGWTYVSGPTHVNGVQACGPVSRVSDIGLIDTRWCTPPTASGTSPPGDLRVTPAGTLLVRIASDWYRAIVDEHSAVRYTLPLPGQRILQLAVGPGEEMLALASASADRTQIRRLIADGTPDPAWQIDVPPSVALAPDAHGLSLITPQSTGASTEHALVRLDRAGRELWRLRLQGFVRQIVTDRLGATYVDLESTSTSAPMLLRVTPTGQLDAAWPTPALSGLGVERWALVSDGRSGDTVLLSGQTASGTLLVRYDPAAERVVAQSALPAGVRSTGVDAQGNLFWATTGHLWLRPGALTADGSPGADRAIADLGGWAPQPSVSRWGEGWAVLGDFSYWFEGLRYSGALRLDAAFRPLPSWQPRFTALRDEDPPPFAFAPRTIVDARGGLIVGGYMQLDGARHLVRFDGSGAPDTAWRPQPDGPITALANAHDGRVLAAGTFTTIGGQSRAGLARIDASGRVDPAWGSSLSLPAQADVSQLMDTGADGVLVVWSTLGGETAAPLLISRITRVVRDAHGNERAEEVMPPTGRSDGARPRLHFDAARKALFLLRPLPRTPSAPTVPTELARVDPATLLPDPRWPVFRGEGRVQLVGADDRFLYVNDGARSLRIAMDDGEIDAGWRQDVFQPWAWWSSAGTRALAFGGPASGATPARLTVVSTDPSSLSERTIIEYYAREVDRFFLTGRAEEQALLDALPHAFVRTGMRFSAPDGATARASLVPICRVHASRERGGSNTHYYGRAVDCQILHAFTRFANEGVDFAVESPIGGACPASAPRPVWRLFNDRVATNDGNHRYVVTTARRDEMVVRGWKDEGVMFCVADAVDSPPFGMW